MKAETKDIIFGFCLGIGASLLIITIVYTIATSQSSSELNDYGTHYRCYYFNSETDCGKTKFCQTHYDLNDVEYSKKQCLSHKGKWLLESQTNEMLEQVYNMLYSRGVR